MGVLDRIAAFLSLEPYRDIQPRTQEDDILNAQIAALRTNATSVWRLPSIDEALAVPAISRAVTLIANTTGSLSMQGFRNGALIETPRVVARPNPFETPRDSYRDMAYQMATSGESVLWIATRDPDGLPAALVVVPLAELTVEDNLRNRLFPVYTWGTTKSTRYSPANPTGEFVHITYLKEPGALRGKGPLQLCGAATSVSVQAQEWAANFYADGGNGGTLIKHAGFLNPDVDEDGLSEADKLRAQWVGKPNNVPRIIDQSIEDVKQTEVNTQGAQMLDAREHQNGDAARMFGIPGELLEYSSSGSSLTYQNVTEVFTEFVKGCLTINYLEPIEQALSDLLPRSTAARFNVKGFLRADIKTRYEVYEKAVNIGAMTTDEVRQEEGMEPGNVEYAPVLPSPPNAVPTTLPRTEVRCDGLARKRRSGIVRIEPCNRLLSLTGGYIGKCPRCHKEHRIIAPPSMPLVTRVVMPESVPPSVPPVAVPSPEAPTEPTARQFIEAVEGLPERIAAVLPRSEPSPLPVIENHLHFDRGSIQVNSEVAAGAIVNNIPPPPAIENKVDFRAVTPIAETEVGEEMLATIRSVENELREQRRPRVVDKQVIRDEAGRIVGVRETES